VAARLVRAVAQQRQRLAARGAGAQLVERRGGVGREHLGAEAAREPSPRHRRAAARYDAAAFAHLAQREIEQRCARRQPPVPLVPRLRAAADGARPVAGDENARAVGGSRRIADALGPDRHRARC
jgi:hypothetical protein